MRARDLLPPGYNFIIYDAYRPRPYQQRLWDKVPDENYVSPPWKGSMHTRGLAVDLSIVNAEGAILDMGTPFDFFGEEAHSDYENHPLPVLENRRLLKEAEKISKKHGYYKISCISGVGVREYYKKYGYELVYNEMQKDLSNTELYKTLTISAIAIFFCIMILYS